MEGAGAGAGPSGSSCSSSSSGHSLIEVLCCRHAQVWQRCEAPSHPDDIWAVLDYEPERYAARRAPSDIEDVVLTIDQGALDLIQKSFGQQELDLYSFTQAIVKAGVYDAEKVLSFIGGVVDLFYEVLRSQPETTLAPVGPISSRTVRWTQVVNYFIESPEIARFEGSQQGKPPGGLAMVNRDSRPEMAKANFVDRAKHSGQFIEKVYWWPYLDRLCTVEATGDSVFFWSPSISEDRAKTVTPKIPELHYEVNDKKELEFDLDINFSTILSAAFDRDSRVLTALMSNRMIISWQLSSKEKVTWIQRGEFQTENLQVEIWWHPQRQLWLTTDTNGLMSFWSLRRDSLSNVLTPTDQLAGHTKKVTHQEQVGNNFFATCSLDRVIIMWDARSLAPDVRIEDHQASVLSLTYVRDFACLVSVGCEKMVYVWTVDQGVFRGLRAKLPGHQANLIQTVSAGQLFFTLDEASIVMLWDAATLQCLQSFGGGALKVHTMTALAGKGRLCLAGRRLYYYEGNEKALIAMGAAVKSESKSKSKKPAVVEENKQAKEKQKTKWCFLNSSCGNMLSVTEKELRLHVRKQVPERPSNSEMQMQFKSIWKTAKNESISVVSVIEPLSLVVVGTKKGAIHFLKYRSGFSLKSYPGKDDSAEGQAQTQEAAAPAKQSRSPVKSSPFVKSKTKTVSAEEPAASVEINENQADIKDVPSTQEIMRGMSSDISCLAVSEVKKVIIVGTVEGRVLVFAIAEGFPVIRWFNNANDTSVVTSIFCSEQFDLLLVGTLDGVVHLYALGSFRSAGSVNIPKILPEKAVKGKLEELGQSLAIRHLRVVPLTLQSHLPVTVLTIDARSRLRLWGLRRNHRTGKVEDLACLFDSGPLLGKHCRLGTQIPPADGTIDAAAAHEAALQSLETPVAFTAVTAFTCQVPLTQEIASTLSRQRAQSMLESESGQDVDSSPNSSPKQKATSGSGGEAKDFTTMVSARDLGMEPLSDTENDEVEESGDRRMPTQNCRRQCVDGNRLLFLADAQGFMYCIDVIDSVSHAREARGEGSPTSTDPRNDRRSNSRGSLGMFLTDTSPKGGSPQHHRFNSGDMWQMDTGTDANAPAPTPEALHVVNWWQAHDDAIESLTPATVPPALVTTEVNHVIKVWSTTGELFSQVSAAPAGPPLVWPPPHVLASQFFLMESSKNLCRRLGLRDRPQGVSNFDEQRPRRRVRGTQHPGNFHQGKKPPAKSRAEAECRFATEPEVSARDRMDSSITEVDSASASSGRHLKPESALEEEEEPGSQMAERVAFILDEEADVILDAEAVDERHTEIEEQDKPSPPKRCFSHSQMQEMIKNHAFSTGLTSFKQLRSVRSQVSTSIGEKEIEAQKRDFFSRHASAFGVELASERDRMNWERGTRGMGPRSTSEGALLRYARNTVETTTRSVYRDLNIDVKNTTMKDIRRPSFVARLDIGRISPDPTDMKSATAQAAYKVCADSSKGRRRESGLAGVGTMALKK